MLSIPIHQHHHFRVWRTHRNAQAATNGGPHTLVFLLDNFSPAIPGYCSCSVCRTVVYNDHTVNVQARSQYNVRYAARLVERRYHYDGSHSLSTLLTEQ